MASLLRVGAARCSRIIFTNPSTRAPFLQPTSFISTSKKNKDSATLTDLNRTANETESLHDKEENWISYGWSFTDREQDSFHYNLFNFTGLFAVFTIAFLFAYVPDWKLRNWVQREAYMELARREREGLPAVDPNFLPVDQIELPPEEELGDFNIVI